MPPRTTLQVVLEPAARDRPDPCRTGSADPRRRAAARRRGSASSCRRRDCGPSSSPWKPRMYAATRREASSASSPKVCMIRAHRGSVARSAIGWSATWMPTARYSRRAMSPNSRTRILVARAPRTRSAPATARTRARPPRGCEVVREAVSRIRRDRHRDAEPRLSSPGPACGCATPRAAAVPARSRC